MAVPTKPTMAKVEPIAALFFRKELPAPVPVATFPSADWVSLGMLMVELKWRLDVETWESGVLVMVGDELDEVREGMLMGDEDEEEVEDEVLELGESEIDEEGRSRDG